MEDRKLTKEEFAIARAVRIDTIAFIANMLDGKSEREMRNIVKAMLLTAASCEGTETREEAEHKLKVLLGFDIKK